MIRRWLLSVIFLILFFLIIPVHAHVPVSAENNDNLNAALAIEKPIKSYVIYGHLHEAGGGAYYQLRMNSGDRLALSLMTNGYDKPIPDMIIMNPGSTGSQDTISSNIQIPVGYSAEIIRGQKPKQADYEPFSPAPIFKVASYSKEITTPGMYYVAVISPADETQYSIAVGYLEEFTLSEWVLVPINVINTHLWEGQSIIAILIPFIAVIIIGLAVLIRLEKRKGQKRPLAFWLASTTGLFYLGGAAITLLQMVRALGITGYSSSIVLTLIFALIPIVLGIWALRGVRSPSPRSLGNRLSLVIIGLLGLVFWAGLIIGPVIAFIAAVVPDRK